MAHDSEYFRRRAAEARAAASSRLAETDSLIAGDLALAYAALARRTASVPAVDDSDTPAIPLTA